MSESEDGRTSEVCSNDSHRTPRTIVLCFDGTNGHYDSANTNVVKFFGLLRKDCPEQQVAYYQAGIGTYFAPGIVSPLWTRLASLLDQAFAWYLDAHVMAGYKYLMNNYRSGDKICLFGFSRGAYTARALGGMLTKVGLLPRDNLQQVGFAYKAYKRTDKEGTELAAGFKQTFSQNVRVEFVGVWDTVQSTGVLVNYVLPFTKSNTGINVFRHALSLDEHRSRFRPNLYHWPEQDDVADPEIAAIRNFRDVKSTFRRLLKGKKTGTQQYQTESRGLPDGSQQNACGDGVAPNRTQSNGKFVEEPFSSTDVLEVWFAGCHSDVGGGNVQDDVEVSLAQIPLRWMIEQVIQSRCGILFDGDKLAHLGFKFSSHPPQPPATCGQITPDSCFNDSIVSEAGPTTREIVDIGCSIVPEFPIEPIPSPGTYPEHSDAVAPLFDQLKINKLWWLLEIMPVSYAWQDSNGLWHNKWSINLGKGRIIPLEKPKFHHTVKERMDYEPLKYKPLAIYNNQEVYV